METRANYVAIGAFVLIIIGAAFGSLYWLYRSSESGATAMLRIVFPEPVTGLSTGGSVLFNGIRVGEVTKLEFQPEGGDNVIAIARVDPTAPIKANTVAKLASQGITGVSYISLTGGTGDSLFQLVKADETPSLTAETSAFTNVLDNLQSVLSRLDTTLGDVNTLVTANRQNVGIVVTNVRTITDELAAAAPQVPSLITDVAGAARALGTAAPQVASVVARVNGVLEAIDPARVASIVQSADQFAAALPEIGNQIRAIVGTAGGVVTRLDDAATRIGEAATGVRDAVAAVDKDAVNAVVADIRTATGVIASRSQAIGTLVDNAAAASGGIRAVAETLGSRTDAVARAVDDASALIGDARRAVAVATPAIEGVGRAIGAISPDRITGIVADVERVTGTLAGQADDVRALIVSAREAAGSINSVTALIAGRNDDIVRTLDNAAGLATNLREASERAPQLVASATGLVDRFSDTVRAVDTGALARIVSDTARFAAGISAQTDEIGRVVSGIAGTVARTEAIASAVAQRTPQLGLVIDNVAAVTTTARAVAERFPALVDTLEPGIKNASAALSAVDPAAVAGIVSDARTLTTALGSQAPAVARIVSSLDGSSARVEAIVSALAQRTPQIGSVIDNVEAVSASARTVASRLTALVDTLEPGVENAANALSAIDPAAVSAIVADARTLVGTLGAQGPVLERALASVATFAGTLAGQGDDIEAFLRTANGTAARVEAVVSAVAQRTPQIGVAIDNVEAATISARAAAARLPEFGATLSPAIENFANVLTAVDPAAVEGIVSDARALTTSLNAQAPAVERIVADIGATAADVRAVTGDVRGRVPTLTAALDDGRAAVADARRFAADLPTLSDRLKPAVASLSDALQAVDPAAVRTIVANVRDVSTTLAASRNDFTALLATASETARQVNAVTGAVAGKVDAIGGAIDDVSAFARELGQAAPDIDTVVASVTDAATSIREAVAAVDADSVRAIVSDLKTTTAAIGSRAGQIGGAIDNVVASARDLAEGLGSVGGEDGALKETIQRAQNIVANIETASNRIGPLVDRATDAFGDKLDVAYTGFNAATGAVERLAGAIAPRAGEITDGIARFSVSGLDDLRALLTQGRSTLAAIESAVSSFDRNPSRVIFGGSDGPRYTPQRR